VVIPTIGRSALLAACVTSILACDPAPAEVVVVDQGGGRAAALLQDRFDSPVVRAIHDRGRGIARATNRGLRAATHPTVLVTHDDCTVDRDWIARGLDLLSRHGGIVTGRVRPPHGARYVPSTIDEPEPSDWTGQVAAGALYPANMVVGREEFLAFGGFDERPGLRLAAEDNDLCYRWLIGGRSLRYEPSLVVWHHDWRSPEQLRATHVTYARGQGAFYAKHLVARDWRVVRLLAWDLRQGFTAPVKARRRGIPRWAEPYYEMNVSLLRGLVAALPEAWRLNGYGPGVECRAEAT
jgi:GT2 family glycosyltransferase